MNMSKSDFLISVVMPIYNTEKFLEQSIDSVIGQTMGFSDNIQLILVNDGSTDTSESICKGYVEKYPDNIVYLSQENSGVSSARNLGLKSVKGKYVNFLDSDDKWQDDAFKILYDFMEKNTDKTDAAAARKILFDGKSGFHGLDYKFSKTMVADLDKNFDLVQNDVTSVLFRAESLKDIEFCEKLRYGEDSRFVNTVLLQKCTLGIVKEAVHFNRIRTDGTSALQTEGGTEGYYFDSPVYLHKYLFDLSKEKYGVIKKFIQYTMMYDITWRIKKPVYKLLDGEKYERYINIIRELVKCIDDDVIYRQRSIYMNMKMYVLSLKYGRDVRKELAWSDGKIKYKNFMAIDTEKAQTLIIWDYFEIKGNVLHLEGKDNCWMNRDDFDYHITVGGKIYHPSYYDCKRFDLVTMEGSVNKGRAVVFDIPLDKDNESKISIFHDFKGKSSEIYTSLGKFSHLPKIDEAYCAKDDIIITRDGKGFVSRPNTDELRNGLEEEYCKVLKSDGKEDIIELRKAYFERKSRQKKKIWMISDRAYVANDNGEHFFRYMNKRFHIGIEAVFNINRDCEDFERMKKYGKVVCYDDDDYKIYFLLSDKIISSSASDYIFNPFGDDKKYLVDIINFDYVFLQHGITKDDISSWINRFNKNIRLMITAALPEYRSVIDGDYYIGEDRVVLTGMARYDELYRKNKRNTPVKKIVIIPTWRKEIKESYDEKSSKSIYYDKFRETDYFKFYNSLINDERLLKAMKDKGYKGLMCMHPMHSEQWIDFTPNDVFEINSGYVDYQKEFIEASMLVTDYSSVAFDFAYLKKPVVYTQFDKDKFYLEHTYKKGYFDYEKNGFGCVCTDIDSAVNAIIAEIENECCNSEAYIERVNEFFPYNDANCCKRIYKSIRGLD